MQYKYKWIKVDEFPTKYQTFRGISAKEKYVLNVNGNDEVLLGKFPRFWAWIRIDNLNTRIDRDMGWSFPEDRSGHILFGMELPAEYYMGATVYEYARYLKNTGRFAEDDKLVEMK